MQKQDILTFFKTLYQNSDPKITFITFTDKGGPETETRTAYGTLREIGHELQAAEDAGGGLFYAVNPTDSEKIGDRDVKRFHAVFIDLDQGFIPELPLEPSAIMTKEGGQSHHLYYFIHPITDADRWKKITDGAVAYFFGDQNAKNIGRKMRLPGTYNRKRGEKLLHELKKCDPVYYTADDLERVFCENKKKTAAREKQMMHAGKAPYDDGNGREQTIFQVIADFKKAGFTVDETIIEAKRFSQRFFISPEDMNAKIHEKANRLPEEDDAEDTSLDVLREKLENVYFVHSIGRYVSTEYPHKPPRDQKSLETTFSRYAPKSALISTINKAGIIKELDNFEYYPGKPATYSRDSETFFNRYRSAEITPNRDDSKIKLFLDHLDFMIPDKRERRVFKQWVAFHVKNPGVKILWAPLLKTAVQGTGKSLIGVAIGKILGAWNIKQIKMKALAADFNGNWAGKSQIVIIHETKGNEEAYEDLKDLITEETIEVNSKNIPQYTSLNLTNFMFFSNNTDPMKIPSDDRRFFVIDSPIKPKEKEYYENLANEIDNHAPELLAYFESFNDMEDFKPKSLPYRTNAHKALASRSEHEVTKIIREKIDTGEIAEIASMDDMKAATGLFKMQTNAFDDAMSALTCVELGRHSVTWEENNCTVTRKPTLYATDNTAYWLKIMNEPNAAKIIKAAYKGIKEEKNSPFATVEEKEKCENIENDEETLKKLMS